MGSKKSITVKSNFHSLMPKTYLLLKSADNDNLIPLNEKSLFLAKIEFFYFLLLIFAPKPPMFQRSVETIKEVRGEVLDQHVSLAYSA